jgi:hypothetical protein
VTDESSDAAKDDIGREAPPTMPTRGAFLLSFAAVVFAGIFGGVIGYGLVDVGCTGDCGDARIFGTVIGALGGAVGVGVVAVLVLRAMAEWKRNPTPRPKGPRRT